MKDDKITITLTFNNHVHKLLISLGNEEEELLYREAAELIRNTIRKYRNLAPDYTSESILELAVLDISHKYVSTQSLKKKIAQWEDTIDGCMEGAKD